MGKPKKRPKTAEEIRQQKRDCEQRRRSRIKENPELYEAAKEKDRKRYADKKQKKQVKLVAQMTPRELRKQRKVWKEQKARSRSKKKSAERLLNHLRENTPETSDDEEANRPQSPSLLENFARVEARPNTRCVSNSSAGSLSRMTPPTQEHSNNSPSTSQSGTPLSRQKQQGVQASRVRRELSNLIIKKQKEKIQDMQRKIHKLQVKLTRAARYRDNQKIIQKRKSVLKEVPRTSKPKTLREGVIKFLERDDNSKIFPGKKDCITKNKVKKQKRALSDTMLSLHKKFQSENDVKISFASFCRLRPFWIKTRQIGERETCLCVIHENMQLMFDKLKYLGLFLHQNLRELCKSVVCDINSYECMLRNCMKCNHKVPEIKTFDDSVETTYKLWTVQKENRMIKGKEKEIRRTVKIETKITKKQLYLQFIKALDRFLIHQYNIHHQYHATTQIKKSISAGEIFVQVDFAENYCCKYSEEIQAVHFGGARQQISLHTGVYYYRCSSSGELKCQSFCTFSECLRHDAGAVFAHMQKILDLVGEKHPMKILHVLSDGPSAQYKNKKSFFLFSQYLTQRYGMEIASWNYSESGHGKGPMDGVGAVLKRTADRVVAQGEDIPDFDAFRKTIESNVTNVITSVVTEAEIKAFDRLLIQQNNSKSIRGTQQIHQITWDNTVPQRIYLRKLSCTSCNADQICCHYSLPQGYKDFDRIPCLSNKASESGEVFGILDHNDAVRYNKDVSEHSNTDDSATVSGTTENEQSDTRFMELKDGMWIVARFIYKKTKKSYIGQVIGFDGGEPKVKFTKKKRITREHGIFIWIEPEDISSVPRTDITVILKEPTPGRRGELLFSIAELINIQDIA